MTSTDEILALVRSALDEFDDRPLPVSVRRACRIASLAGDSQTAVRLSLELTGIGNGDPVANREAVKRFLPDPEMWDSEEDSPGRVATREFLRDRMVDRDNPESLTDSTSVPALEWFTATFSRQEDTPDSLAAALRTTNLLELIRHRTFTYLCEWERRFGYSSINDSIFGGYKATVDRLLNTGVPGLVEQFTAVYRRLNEAASNDPDKPAAEELAQATTTCRRILEAVVDHALPAQQEPSATGNKLDQPAYRNRLFEFIKMANASASSAEMMVALTEGLHSRYTAVSKLTNKGVHASIALRTANLVALNTYIICGEILQLKEQAETPQSS
ncbi:hypothetical protein [Streptacidiphilus sp. EB129]|uniref:hypothetical protein n=1 Tax=Streptacidiphilus sp. EB129 TaxID=3156262 RepID=UPI003511A37E